MPEFTVPLQGGGAMTVNASDPQAAIENVEQQGGSVGGEPIAGGHMIGGPGHPPSPDGGGGGGGGGGGAAPINTGNPATVGATTANPGTMFGMKVNAAGSKPEDRTRAIYEFREGENLQDWMSRVFQQGTRDFGGTLSPDSSNPYARTPYASWFQRRYSDVVPANTLLDMILNNKGGQEDFAPQLEGAMKGFIGSGEGRGFGTGTAGAASNLGGLNDLLNSFMNKDTANLSPDQMAMLGGLGDDPRAQMSLVNAQLSGGMGANPLASKYVNQLGAQMMDEYYDDPVGRDPATNGSFLQNFMRKLNMSK